MAESRPALRRALPLLAFLACAGFAASALADVYDDAVAHPGRPERDLKRDQIEHPAEVLRLSGIKPGMKVGDFLGADGYYSELVSYVVGPKGQVYILNNKAYDAWSENHWQERIGGASAERRAQDRRRRAHGTSRPHSLDAAARRSRSITTCTGWMTTRRTTGRSTTSTSVLNEMSRVLKPGGVAACWSDHSAKPGTGAQQRRGSAAPDRRSLHTERLRRSTASSSSARPMRCAGRMTRATRSLTRDRWSARPTASCWYSRRSTEAAVRRRVAPAPHEHRWQELSACRARRRMSAVDRFAPREGVCSDECTTFSTSQRFLRSAASRCTRRCLSELIAGRKRSHWMWFIFPQLAGLGSSPTARAFAIAPAREALRLPRPPAARAAPHEDAPARCYALEGRTVAGRSSGYPDDLKFRSSMTLFAPGASSRADRPVFARRSRATSPVSRIPSPLRALYLGLRNLRMN